MGQCASWEDDHCPRMRRAIKSDDVIAVQKLLAAGVDIDVPLDAITGNTALILAACYGAARTLPLVLDVGADPDACNKEGRSALDKAVLSYALAHNLCLHKMAEEQRRYFILRVLVASGSHAINPKELELCVRMNESDRTFLHNLVHVIKRAPSQRLKSVALTVLIKVDVHHAHIKTLLLSGATLDDFCRCFRASTWRTRIPLSTDVIQTIIRATSDVTILRMMSGHFSCVMKSPRSPMPTSVATLLFLAGGQYGGDFRPRPSRVSGAVWRALLSDVPYDGPPTLRHMCRVCVREHCVGNVYHATQALPLPTAFIPYITLESPL